MTRTGAFHFSELSAVRRCPQKHHYAYVEGLRSKAEALNLKRGLWLHAMLQADALKRGLAHESLLEVPDEIDVAGIDGMVLLEEVTAGGWQLLLCSTEDINVVEAGYDLSWKGMLQLLTEQSDYALMPDDVIEERYTVGGQDLPTACRNIMRGYLWQYRNELPKRKPLLVEASWSRTLSADHHPDVDMEGRADLVEIDERGLTCLVDWKSTKSLPGQEFKLMESQRYIYLWGLEERLAEHGVKVQALAFDYLITSTPTVPKQNQPKKAPKTKSKCKDCNGLGGFMANGDPIDAQDPEVFEDCEACEATGKRLNMPTPNELIGELSTAQIKTTPLVYFETVKELGLEMTEHHRQKINELEADNEFYRRFNMPVNIKALRTVLRETGSAAQVADHFRTNPETVYRNVDRSCSYMCDFLPICMAELHYQDVETIKERDYEPRKPEKPSACGATHKTQKGATDVCERDAGHTELAHRGRIAEWS